MERVKSWWRWFWPKYPKRPADAVDQYMAGHKMGLDLHNPAYQFLVVHQNVVFTHGFAHGRIIALEEKL